METIKKIFPFAFKFVSTTKEFVISLILYIVANCIAVALLVPIGALMGLTVILIPVEGLLVAVVGVYFMGTIVLHILAFCKVFKN